MSAVRDALVRVRGRVLAGCTLTGIPAWIPKPARTALDRELGYTKFDRWVCHVTCGRTDIIALLDRAIANCESDK